MGLSLKKLCLAGVAVTAIVAGSAQAEVNGMDGRASPAVEPVTGQADTSTAQSRAAARKASKKAKPRKSAGGTYQLPAPQDSPAQQSAGGADAPANLDGESGRLQGDIIVRGVRENVKAARNIKRRAQQIVDVVVAQDIGKLPDKNVTEALARVPGVQIDRSRGEGLGVRIRGLSEVLTTINGSQSFSGAGRNTFLNDIPSDLISGIEVYKTRTPDQIEGSQTGVVNLSLRRPTDFAAGTTIAVNAKGEYFDQVKRVNPSVNALIAWNANTGIGQIGVMLNASYSEVYYNESGRWNGFPRRIGDNRQIVDPGTVPAGLFFPDSVGIVYRRGFYKRPAIVGSAQWKATDALRFTLEGSARRTHAAWLDDNFNIPLTFSYSDAPPPRLTNVVVGPDGRLVSSLTANSLDPFGPAKNSWDGITNEYTGRFQLDYTDEKAEITAWVNYFKSGTIPTRLTIGYGSRRIHCST